MTIVAVAACKGQAARQTSTEGGTAPPNTPAATASAQPTAGSQTARADLAEASKAARAWQSDAALCWVSTIVAGTDGKAQQFGGWDYRFCSKAAGQQYAVSRTPSGVSGSSVGKADRSTVPDDFIDSDQAIAAATQAGFAPQGHTVIMELDPAPGGKGFAWVISDVAGMAANKQFVVDAKTGKMISSGK